MIKNFLNPEGHKSPNDCILPIVGASAVEGLRSPGLPRLVCRFLTCTFLSNEWKEMFTSQNRLSLMCLLAANESPCFYSIIKYSQSVLINAPTHFSFSSKKFPMKYKEGGWKYHNNYKGQDCFSSFLRMQQTYRCHLTVISL